MDYDGDIVSVFVCHFHVKKGNLVEWSFPDSFDLVKENSAVEFKSLPSGSHLVERDTILFRVGDLFAISHLRNVNLRLGSVNDSETNLSEDDDERGSRMRSIGFICTSTEKFELYREFLTTDPSIDSIYERKQSSSYTLLEDFVRMQNASPIVAGKLIPFYEEHGFPSLIDTFGVQLLVLWRLSLLNLRILFYSSPPLDKICNQLFPISLLPNSKYNNFIHSLQNPTYHNSFGLQDNSHSTKSCLYLDCEKAKFYTSLLDISENRDGCFSDGASYFACTSDKVIEETMKNCYDVFVDGDKIRTWRKDLSSVIKPTRADKQRLAELKRLKAFHSESPRGEIHYAFLKYFTDLNDQIMKVLMQTNAHFDAQPDFPDGSFAISERSSILSDNLGMELSSSHLSSMGLLPNCGDMEFMQELVSYHNLNVVVVKDAGCCPIFSF